MGNDSDSNDGSKRIWSHSRLEAYDTCPLKYRLRYQLHLNRIPEQRGLGEHHLLFGAGIHEGLRVLYLGGSVAEAQDVFSATYPVALDARDRAKTPEGGREALAQYAERWREEDQKWEMLECETLAAVDEGSYVWTEHRDMVWRHRRSGAIYCVDNKTTKKSIVGFNGGPFTSTLLYNGASTTGDLLTVGNSSAPSSSVYLNNFKVQSNTTMSANCGVHLIQLQRSTVDGVIADGQDGTGKLYNGICFERFDDVNYINFWASGSNESVQVYGNPVADTLRLDNGRITPACPGGVCGTTGVGLHIGGGSGGIHCSNVDIAKNNLNVLIDNSLAAVANRQLFFHSGCIIDSAVSTDNVQINDTLAANASADFYDWNASAARYDLNVISWVSGIITVNGGNLWNATSDCVHVATSSARLIVSASVAIHSCGGWGINSTVSNVNILSSAMMYSNVTGNVAPNANNHVVVNGSAESSLAAFQVINGGLSNDDNGGLMQLTNIAPSTSAVPNKYLRVDRNGDFNILNNAYSLAIMDIKDTGDFKIAGAYIFNQTTVGLLPVCNGSMVYHTYAVSDASGPTWGSIVAGTGSVPTIVMCDGVHWLVH